jgi:membrane protease YdiL (CAAX protease family)
MTETGVEKTGSAARPAWLTGTFRLGGLVLDTRSTIVVVSSTLLLVLGYYRDGLPVVPSAWSPALSAGGIDTRTLASVLYYLLIPLFIIGVVFGEPVSNYGFRAGDWRQGLKWSALVILMAAPILYGAAHTTSMTQYYAGAARQSPAIILARSAVELFGWEFLFRGFLLFGLLRVIGPSAVVIQAVPFALAHLGKPEIETLSTIFGGTLFGWIAWRSHSFLYAFLVHWFIMSFVILAAKGWI